MSPQLNKARWALARLTFIGYISFAVVSLVGGFLSAPLMSWYFFGDWRFWRHWSAGRRLLPHAFRLLNVMLRDDQGFMFSVPLTSPPRSTPDPVAAALRPDWPNGRSCGTCSNCCRAGGYTCPLLDEDRGLCRGHDSFYWRYFNCGRFPSVTAEVDYYDCRKWALARADSATALPAPGILYRSGLARKHAAGNRPTLPRVAALAETSAPRRPPSEQLPRDRQSRAATAADQHPS